MIARKSNPFLSALLRIDRAERHLENLKTQIEQFWARRPYAHAVEDDGIYKIHKIAFTERFPAEWRLLLTEIIEHLRASLDHATWAAGVLHTRDEQIRCVAFPFGKTAADVENVMMGRCKNLPPEIHSLLRGLEPYQGGKGNTLYALNSLCNSSKHALTTLVACGVVDPGFRVFRQQAKIDFLLPLVWDSEKNEIPYLRVERRFDLEHQANIKAFVAIEYGGETSSEDGATILRLMHEETKSVVLAIERECRRLGLVS